MGDIGVIVSIAKENFIDNENVYYSIENAIKEFEFALKEALEYVYVSKEEKKKNKKAKLKELKEEVRGYVKEEEKKEIIRANFTRTPLNRKERILTREIISIMNECGIVYNPFDLYDYIIGCIKIDRMHEKSRPRKLNANNIYKYISKQLIELENLS